MGHFDILLFQTPEDLFETALEAGTFWAKTDPFTASVGPEWGLIPGQSVW